MLDFFEPRGQGGTKVHKGPLCNFLSLWLCGSIRQYVLLTFTLLVCYVSQAQQTFLITSFGAKGDGKTMNTTAIQKAIDAAAQKGGTVVVSKGEFVTGPIVLKFGVELHLEKEAVLLGSTIRLDYGAEEARPLISAVAANRVSITGRGTIDGRGKEVVEDLIVQLAAGKMKDKQWPLKAPREDNRPQILNLKECTAITVQGVTIKNSAAWVQSYVRCNGVVIDSITVQSTAYWNNDGIDIVKSKNVSIMNCNINASDDAICLKSEGSVLDSCVNVYVANCKLRSSASAFKLGTDSRGGFRNIKVKDIEVYDTYRSAIALEAVDGGFLEDVKIKGLRAINTGNAIFIRLGHRNKGDTFSTVKNIFISDVYVEVPSGKPDGGYPLGGPGLKYPPGFTPVKGVVQSISPWNNSSRDSTAIPYPHNVFPTHDRPARSCVGKYSPGKYRNCLRRRRG